MKKKINKQSEILNVVKLVSSLNHVDNDEKFEMMETLSDFIFYADKVEDKLIEMKELLNDLKSKLNDVEGQIILANLNNEKTVDEDAQEYLDKIKL